MNPHSEHQRASKNKSLSSRVEESPPKAGFFNYFLYARKSTDDEDRQILSIEAQLAELREFARKESLTIVREFVEAKTAKVPGRPLFNQMIELIEKDEASGILSWHPDRLA